MGQDWSQWLPRRPGIIFDPGIIENGGLRVMSGPCMFGVWIFEHTSTFRACRGLISRAAVFRGCFCELEVSIPFGGIPGGIIFSNQHV